MSDMLMALHCAMRALPLFFASTPKTPLRVLCVIALDLLHRVRHARQMPQANIRNLSAFLDYATCVNAIWDRKALSALEHAGLRRQLEEAGLRACIDDYASRLSAIEGRRPDITSGASRFDAVRSYREAVARVSLAGAVAVTARAQSLDAAIEATETDPDLAALLRIVMQCQVIDDVLDSREDEARALPSFLTATASRSQALALTGAAARDYGAGSGGSALPLRAALRIVTLLTRLIVTLAKRPGWGQTRSYRDDAETQSGCRHRSVPRARAY